MASFLSGEEKPSSRPGLTLETSATRLVQQPSRDTFASDHELTPAGEKRTEHVRASNVSTPTSSHANPFDTDIEAIITTSEQCMRKSTDYSRGGTGGTDCQVWPGQDHWKKKAKAAKMKKHSCNCLAHLSKRNRIMVKVLIGLLIVATAVGVGFGVSKPLGAGIWRSDTNN
ncbi:hypothetical protein B0T17DRAFT_612626 [Bombardia bombarda]|uniref:Uncharacterized protein n=1 Tax=Bombardia bombarda TaxID=252184 RepID=A0AA40CEH8_9PEZI|nr:hypothetical protein B0T17DRAFT_612626 [Bombardia bombarda]